jgi:DNA repair protein RadC
MLCGFMPSHKTQETTKTKDTTKTQDRPEQLSFETLLFPTSEYGIVAEARARSETQKEIEAVFRRYAPVFSVRLVHTDNVGYRGGGKIRSPRDTYDLMAPIYQGLDREIFSIILLSTKNDVIGINLVSVGDLSSAIVHPREVMKSAILANASNIIAVHNHPSGDLTPSPEDMAVTKRLKEVCEVMGIGLLDHVLLNQEGRFRSFKEEGFI